MNAIFSSEKKAVPLQCCIDCCARFPSNHVVVVGWIHDAANAATVEILSDSRPIPGAVLLRGSRSDVTRHYKGEEDRPWGFVAICALPASGADAAQPELALRVRAGTEAWSEKLSAEPQALAAELNSYLEHFEQEERATVIRALAAALGPAICPESGKPPTSLEAFQAFVRMAIDYAVITESGGNGRGVFLSGWLFDPASSVVAVHVKIGNWVSKDILPLSVRGERNDVVQAFPQQPPPPVSPGVVGFVPIDAAIEGLKALEHLELRVVTKQGELGLQAVALAKPNAPLEQTKPLLAVLNLQGPGGFEVLDKCVGPAVASLWVPPSRAEGLAPVEELQFGTAPEAPKRTVIVPLYGRYDFIFYQLSQFCMDPDFAETDLVYVVDDPTIYPGALDMARDVSPMVPSVPFRILRAPRNLGFAGANNLGARYAHTRLLVLLNSDVLPTRPGWLSALEAQHAALPDAGALGVRLLYHDGTIQHDGMRFYRNPLLPGVWLNEHPAKGLPEWLAPTEPVTEVPAVTAACVMLSRDLYEQVEGLDEGYVLGDFEDSDLCLKLLERGRKNYLVRSVKLYHLERQSQALFRDLRWRQNLTLYNAWRHTRRWSNLIEGLQAMS